MALDEIFYCVTVIAFGFNDIHELLTHVQNKGERRRNEYTAI
jgi:hypothetical protein